MHIHTQIPTHTHIHIYTGGGVRNDGERVSRHRSQAVKCHDGPILLRVDQEELVLHASAEKNGRILELCCVCIHIHI